MNKACDNICNKILMNKQSELTELEKEHLATCQECQIMADQWSAMKSIPTAMKEPPMSVEFVIKREAQRVAHNRQYVKKSMIRWASIASIAACAVFILWMSLNTIKNDPEVLTPGLNISQNNSTTNSTALSSVDSLEEIIIQENLQYIEPKENTVVATNSATTDWDSLDFSDDFIEIEAELAYCKTSI